jgi:hypothetical protein
MNFMTNVSHIITISADSLRFVTHPHGRASVSECPHASDDLDMRAAVAFDSRKYRLTTLSQCTLTDKQKIRILQFSPSSFVHVLERSLHWTFLRQ